MVRNWFEPNYGGYRAKLESGEVQGVADSVAKQIQSAATSRLSADWGLPPDDEHYETGPFETKVGATGIYVRTHTEHARRHEAKHKTLKKAAHSARVG